ncbi:hypothetical protein TELCIR_14157, partial [Teladorsagia circumcincta]
MFSLHWPSTYYLDFCFITSSARRLLRLEFRVITILECVIEFSTPTNEFRPMGSSRLCLDSLKGVSLLKCHNQRAHQDWQVT